MNMLFIEVFEESCLNLKEMRHVSVPSTVDYLLDFCMESTVGDS